MGLSIVRYRNYGKAMEAEPNKNNIVTQNFYWCFFELSNGAIIDINYTENYDDNGKDLGADYWASYTEDYSFDLTFPEWFEGTFKRPKDKPIYKVTDEEFNIVKEFYVDNLHSKRDIKTSIVDLNN